MSTELRFSNRNIVEENILFPSLVVGLCIKSRLSPA